MKKLAMRSSFRETYLFALHGIPLLLQCKKQLWRGLNLKEKYNCNLFVRKHAGSDDDYVI